MQFTLAYTSRPSIFLPYKTHNRNYHLLFNRSVPKKSVLSVTDSIIATQSFFTIGNILLDDYNGERCGYIFFSTLPIACHGSCIVAYSRKWSKAVNEKRFPLNPFGVSLLLKDKEFHLYHKKNQVSLVVSPNMALKIKENLEV